MFRPIITLITDFGQADGYVGTMKGVILDICPEAALVDLSHDVRPQAVPQAAYVLSAAAPYFPAGTVHLVVVDPGVGSQRRPIVVHTERATYVAPDNGVLDLVLLQDPPRLAIHLTKPAYRLPQVSATFHGRDIFAPAAAHLAHGTDPREMGTLLPLSDLVTLPNLQPQPQPDGSWSAQVLHIDRFGNLITNLQSPSSTLRVVVAGHHITGPSRTFVDVAPGEFVAYVGSSGHLEIAVREGNAAARLGIDVGDSLRIEGLP
jgi:S-adenosylmethionine hydrolase